MLNCRSQVWAVSVADKHGKHNPTHPTLMIVPFLFHFPLTEPSHGAEDTFARLSTACSLSKIFFSLSTSDLNAGRSFGLFLHVIAFRRNTCELRPLHLKQSSLSKTRPFVHEQSSPRLGTLSIILSLILLSTINLSSPRNHSYPSDNQIQDESRIANAKARTLISNVKKLASSIARWLKKGPGHAKMTKPPTTPPSNPDSSPTSVNSVQYDGPIDASPSNGTGRRRRLPGDVCAVFVHAGAGYHSIQNERVHLAACEE